MKPTSRQMRCIHDHLALVQPIARHYAIRTGHDHDDLVQVGRLGLIKAVSGFRQDDQRPFSAYARPHIRGAILHYLRDQAGLVRLPRRVEERVQQLRRNPAADLSPEDDLLMQHYASKTRWAALQEHHHDGAESRLEQLDRQDQHRQVRQALMALSVDERAAVTAVVLEGHSLRSAADRANVSAMTIQRRLKRGLKRLSELLNPSQLGWVS
ncbi:sigma-70 family RNA polymerase sigma factor [Parasynechococcus sp.]|uniref:sigma-70 family RNA polymerase sigma factor n=1 Tax=Parasynechococcus sp. TaxID=3101203 RepID=UPI003704B8F9